MRVSHETVLAMTFALAVLVEAVVIVAPRSQGAAVLTTAHFAFYSDLQTNVHDALIDAAGARRVNQPALFEVGEERACFDRLPLSDRQGWTSAVDAYSSRRVTPLQRLMIRWELAGLLRRDSVTDPADAKFLDETARSRMAATSAYQRCRWAAQDAQNRDWITKLRPLLARYEDGLGRELPKLFQVPWAGLPFRVDVVHTGNALGGDSATPSGPPTLHILVSSTNPSNQGEAALELVFHEASHSLTHEDSPLAVALASAARDQHVVVPPDLLHRVHFFITGVAVQRAFARDNDEYTPNLFRLKLFGDDFRTAVVRTWPAYMDGQRTLEQAAADLVRALAGLTIPNEVRRRQLKRGAAQIRGQSQSAPRARGTQRPRGWAASFGRPLPLRERRRVRFAEPGLRTA